MSSLAHIRHPRERKFAETFFQSEDDWEYQPGPYYLYLENKKIRFTPDFLDKKRNVLIEVVGSRQAFNYNKKKYVAFSNIHKNFEVRTYDTHNLLNFKHERVEYVPLKAMNAYELAKLTDISVRHAYYLLARKRRPSIDLAERLEDKTGIPAEAWLFPDRFPNPYLDPNIVHVES